MRNEELCSVGSHFTIVSFSVQKAQLSTSDPEHKQQSLKRNGRKKILVIGNGGAGKSTLCNVLAGDDPKSDNFPVSSGVDPKTGYTQLANVFFNGDRGKPISIIDTEGFNSDSDKISDAKIISGLVGTLQKKCDFINLFVIAINGTEKRFGGAVIGMLRILEGMFGEHFWKNAIVVFSHISMDPISRKKRELNYGRTDNLLGELYVGKIKLEFPKIKKKIPFVIIDALRTQTDPGEENFFVDSMKKLWQCLDKAPSLSVKQFDQTFKGHKNEANVKAFLKQYRDEFQKEKEQM